MPERLAAGPNTTVVIVAEFGSDVQSYARAFAELSIPRPRDCPHCEAVGRLIGHGSYPRTVIDPGEATLIRVKRWLCAVCRQTVSILPSFCLPWRHYRASVIQTVLDGRFASGVSWSAILGRFQPADLPTATTCREWARTFAQRSPVYLQPLLRQLAQWQLGAGKLEVAVEEVATKAKVPEQLVAAVPHLVAFLHDHGVPVAAGVSRWLPTLWQWGHGGRLGRLV